MGNLSVAYFHKLSISRCFGPYPHASYITNSDGQVQDILNDEGSFSREMGVMGSTIMRWVVVQQAKPRESRILFSEVTFLG